MIILASMIDEPGDLVKFQTLYSLYSGAMYTTAFNILENADDAEDAVQISSLKIIKNLNRLEMEEIHDIKTKSFLLTIARNTALEKGRRSRFLWKRLKWMDLRQVQRRSILIRFP